MNGLEYALKRVMLENEKLRKERKSREDQESHERKFLLTKDLVRVQGFCGNDFYKTHYSNIRSFKPKIPVLSQIFQFLQKVIFADLNFIRLITPKSDWYYNRHPLYNIT